jgi:UDP-N-acetyl-D-mannosaminuronate dehydrogenase
MKKIAVIGLGYVGLPLAGLCAKRYEVIALERNTAVVECLKSGKSHIQGLTDMNDNKGELIQCTKQ